MSPMGCRFQMLLGRTFVFGDILKILLLKPIFSSLGTIRYYTVNQRALKS